MSCPQNDRSSRRSRRIIATTELAKQKVSPGCKEDILLSVVKQESASNGTKKLSQFKNSKLKTSKNNGRTKKESSHYFDAAPSVKSTPVVKIEKESSYFPSQNTAKKLKSENVSKIDVCSKIKTEAKEVSSKDLSKKDTKKAQHSGRKRKNAEVEKTDNHADNVPKKRVKKEPTIDLKNYKHDKKTIVSNHVDIDRHSPKKNAKKMVTPKQSKHYSPDAKKDIVPTVNNMSPQIVPMIPMASECNEDEASSSEEESDWEDVEEIPSAELPGAAEDVDISSQVPDKAVEITLDAPDLMNRKKKKKFDMEDWFRREANRYQKEMQICVHKVSLLCLLAHGLHRNSLCNDKVLHGLGLSLVPQQLASEFMLIQLPVGVFHRFTRWFRDEISIDSQLRETTAATQRLLISRFSKRKVASEVEYVLLFVIILRSLGVDVRLIYSLQPVTHKPSNKMVKKRKKEPEVTDVDSKETSPADGKKPQEQSKSAGHEKPSSEKKSDQVSNRTKEPKSTTTKPKCSKNAKTKIIETNKVNRNADKKSEPKPGTSKSEYFKNDKGTKRQSSRRKSTEVTYIDVDSDSDSNEGTLGKKLKRNTKKKGKTKSKDEDVEMVSISSDSEFEPEETTFTSPGRRNKKALSSDSDGGVSITKDIIKQKGRDIFVEVYAPKDKKWVCIDCVQGLIGRPKDVEKTATNPVSYVIAFTNDSKLKDLTAHYAAGWLSSTRKLRVVEDWWQETLKPFRPHKTERDENEDLQLFAKQVQKPLPTSIQEFKNHPLYALERHLLKFEAIYPRTAVPVGYVRKEPVYARECVKTLHTRETWLKEGKAVRLKEVPYKIVKGRKKRNAMDLPAPAAELFGDWQIEEYIPFPAVNGKIPRNEYGNVELFKPSMLPGGTVHLKVPGLNKVAKKLDVDCVPAMVGWDFHGGWNHPILDGWIVCEEHQEMLIAAAAEQQEVDMKRALEKREKRVLGNWKLLVRGLFIRERLKRKYNLQEYIANDSNSATPSTSQTGGEVTGQKARDLEMSWPRNLQADEPESSNKPQSDGLFPFEQI